MKIVRFTDAPQTSSPYVAWQQQQLDYSRHADIDLPREGMVEMIDRLMLRVQASLQPRVTWNRTDHWILHTTAMRWSSPTAQLELSASLTDTGCNVWLYPHFNKSRLGGDYTSHLACWTIRRIDNTYSWDAPDYGKLEVHRSEMVAGTDFRTTRLQVDDPIFDGIPRRESKPWERVSGEPPELGADVITVTQGYINAAMVC